MQIERNTKGKLVFLCICFTSLREQRPLVPRCSLSSSEAQRYNNFPTFPLRKAIFCSKESGSLCRTLRPGSPPFSGQRRESRFCGESLQSGFVPYRGWSAVYATILNDEVIMQNCSATTTNLLIFNGMMAEQFCSSHRVCMM